MGILRYAGIGPRNTPTDQLEVMTHLAEQLALTGWRLSSGWGDGADQAFAQGAPINRQSQWVPWRGFNGANAEQPFKICQFNDKLHTIAALHHPYWDRMKDPVRKLMMRNVAILGGDDLSEPVDMVLYWQSEEDETSLKSGTNHTRRVARAFSIPSFNIRKPEDQQAICDFTAALEARNQEVAA